MNIFEKSTGQIRFYGFVTALFTFCITLVGYQGEVVAASAPDYIMAIRKARAKLKPFDEADLVHATKEYNKVVKSPRGLRNAKRCLRYLEAFHLISRRTGYPIAYVAGIAFHESDGCRTGASDQEGETGGKSLMQLTGLKNKTYRRRAATLLGIKLKELSPETNVIHNVALGMVLHDSFELIFGSRPHGLLAYNMGPGNGKAGKDKNGKLVYRGVKDYIMKMGKTMRSLPSLAQMRRHLLCTKRVKPRLYVDKVLAGVAVMNKMFSGEKLEKVSTLSPGDVPGFYPKDDGQWPVQILASNK